MYPYSRTSRSYPDWNGGSSYHSNSLFVGNQDYNSARGWRDMSRREREEVHQRAHSRRQDPYSTLYQRTDRNDRYDIYAAEDAERREHRHRRRRTNVNDLTNSFAGLNMGSHRSDRNHSARNVHWHDHHMPAAPEPPRVAPRNAEYYLNRAQRASNTHQDNYNDAYQYIYGQQPPRHTTLSSRRVPHESTRRNVRFGTGSTRQHNPSESFRDRVRRWF